MLVLIVEDNPINAKLLAVNLEKVGYQTLVASTGKEALEHLDGNPDIQLVISDIMMPEMDGLELLRLMKEDHRWKDIPLIVSTSLADLETVKKAARLGCHHYITKPLKVPDLLEKVRSALEEVDHGGSQSAPDDEKSASLGDPDGSQEVASEPDAAGASGEKEEEEEEEEVSESLRIFEAAVMQSMATLGKGTPTAQDLSESLPVLLEGSKRIGASRLVMVVSRLKKNMSVGEVEIDESLRQLLLKELKFIKRALDSPTGVPGF